METETDVTIVSVYKPGKGFSSDYVSRLKEGVDKFCQASHKFVCLTNSDIKGVESIPIIANRDGYWNKLEVFRKGLFDGPVVYLDLDTIIINDVTDILTYPHEFTAGYNFKRKHIDSMASWFMAFDGRDDYEYLFDGFTSSTPEKYEQDWARWGDQGYTQDNLQRKWTSIDELFPGRCASYKYEIRRPWKIPPGVSFIAFHGRPRPHEINWELPSGD